MKKETYIRMTELFRKDPKKAGRLELLNHLLTGAVYISYPLLLLGLFFQEPQALTRAILVPLDGFIILSVFRHMVNRKRPYEFFGLPPVIHKTTQGKSFPSRHVFSAFIIAMTFCFQPGLLPAGILLLFIAAAIAATRVVAGVHFISDVIAGALAGIVFAIIGFFV